MRTQYTRNIQDGALTVLIATAVVLGAHLRPVELSAQESNTRFGAVGGWVSNEQIWQPTGETEAVGGVLLGAFAHAQTPVPWFSILVEGLFVQRGGNVLGGIEGETATGGVRSDYVTFNLHLRVTAPVGPASVHFAAGPTIDQLLQNRVDSGLAPVLQRESPTVLSASAAAGLGFRVNESVRVEVEARIVEGLGDAHSGGFVSFRNRSKEVLARVAFPIPGR